MESQPCSGKVGRILSAMRCLMCCLLIPALLSGFFSAWAKALSYEEYMDLSGQDRAKLASKYVKSSKDGYHNVLVKNYDVYTDVSPEYAVRMAVLMDGFHERFSSIFNGPFKVKNKPALYVLADDESYAKALDSYTDGKIEAGWSYGMFVSYGFKRALFAKFGSEEKECYLVNILFHEGTHQLLDSYIGGDIPVWFNEGTATNFETWEIGRSVKNNINNAIFKSVRARHIPTIYPDRGFFPLRKLLAVSGEDWIKAEDPLPQYASAWALMNCLLCSEKGRDYFQILIGGFRSGKSRDKIMPDKTIESLESFYAGYIKDVILPHDEIWIPIEKLIAVEKHKEAREHAASMKEKFPNNPYAAYYAAWLPVRDGDKAPEYLKILLALEKKSPAHPELFFAISKAYMLQDNLSLAEAYARKMLVELNKHAPSLKLLEEIKKLRRERAGPDAGSLLPVLR